MEQETDTNVFVSNREREYLSKLCCLLHDAGTLALRTIFNSIHPGISLKDHLAHTHIQSVLVKLHQQKAISEKQWKILYPPTKGVVSSQYYDSRIIVILLQTICHLSPPYPNGWSANPLPTDTSLSADVVRLQILLQQIGSLVGVRDDEYPVLWRQIVEVLLRHGGSAVRVKIQRIDDEQLSPDQQTYYIQQVKHIWGNTDSGVGALKHLNGPRSLIKPSGGSRKKKTTDEHEGLSLEDKVVLSKMYRLLVENIVVDDIIDRLQQGQIIKITDRQEIIALSKNSERMQYVLNKIQNSKSPYALKLLFDSLKFKYSKIYEEVTEFRKLTYKQGVKETKDMVGLCTSALKAHYNNVFSKCCPLPWNDNYKMPVKDYFTPVDIIHSVGDKVHLSDMLPPRATGNRGNKVILEGESGSGKSMLASMLAFQWASKPAFFTEYYRFLLLVDVEVITGDVRQSIYTQTMSNHSKVTCDEFWATMESNAEDVVLLIDGFSGGHPEINKLIDGTLLKQSAVIVLINTTTSMSRVVKPDYKLYNIGLNANQVPRCLRIYAGMVHIGADDFDSLLEDLMTCRLGIQMCHPFICMVIIFAFKYAKLNVNTVTTISSLFQTYIKALATQFCKKQHILLADYGFPLEIKDLVDHIEKLCFTVTISDKTSFHDGEIMGEAVNINIMKLGVFQRSITTGQVKVHCSLLNSLLSARYLTTMSIQELQKTLDQRNILKYTKYSDIVAFMCGIYTKYGNHDYLETVFNALLQMRNGHRSNLVDESKADLGENLLQAVHLVNLNPILQSLMECPGNVTMSQQVVNNLPQAISLHKRGLYPIQCLLGLSRVLRSECSNLVRFDMAMHPYYLYQHDVYMELATALSECKTLKVIKATWSRLDMIAQFLATATQHKQDFDLVYVDTLGRSVAEDMSVLAWNDLQTLCENLGNTRKFVFRRCNIASIAGHIIKFLPKSIKIIDFSHTSLNLFCATELASHIEHSRSLISLNLSSTGLEGSSIVALAHGLKLSSSIEELRLCGNKFDRSGMTALSQALRLVTTLDTLDIEGCDLTIEMCKVLASALIENRSVRTLVLTNANIPAEGRMLMYCREDENFTIVVTDKNKEMPV